LQIVFARGFAPLTSFCDRLQVIERLRRAGLDVPVLRQLDLCVLPHLVDLALSDVPPQSAGDKRE